MATTWYADYDGSAGSGDGSSFANRAANPNSITPVAGDTVRVKQSLAATSLGNATWTNTNQTVTLASAQTLSITTCESIWTGVTNVTASVNSTNQKQGSGCASLAVAAAFTTGKVGFFALGSTVDFSAYQQISFWFRASTTLASGVFQLKLCSDTAGATPVNTINIPAVLQVNKWDRFTVNVGGALGSNIQSIALYAVSDPATVTVLLDNIFAALAPGSTGCLHLTTPISKNSGNEGWWLPQSIVGSTVLLDFSANTGATGFVQPLYYGTTETVATYTMEPSYSIGAAAGVSGIITTAVAGTSGSPITYSGGWNRTDMSTQTGYTLICGQNGQGHCLYATQNYISFDHFICAGMDTAASAAAGANNLTASNIYGCNLQDFGTNLSGSSNCSFNNFILTAIGNNGVNVTYGSNNNFTNYWITTVNTNTSVLIQSPVFDNGSSNIYTNFTINSIATSFYSQYGNIIKLINWTTNVIGNATFYFPQSVGNIYAESCTFNEATRIANPVSFGNNTVYSQDEGGTIGNTLIYSDGMSGGYDYTNLWWYLSPTSTNRSASYPCSLQVGRIGCRANALVTVSMVVNRTNTGLTGALLVKGNQISGVPNDVVATTSGTAGQDETLTITFTPTAQGVVNILGQAYGGTTYSLYIKSMNIYQA